LNFIYHLPTKIIFGQPAAKALVAELAELKVGRVLLVSDPGLVRLGLMAHFQAALLAAGLTVTLFSDVSTNPTTVSVEQAVKLVKVDNLEAVIALGGGSPIDVAKAAAMLATNGGSYADYQWGGRPITKPGLPLLAIPTTAGTGSEVSKVAVIVDPANPFKKGVLSPHMFARAAILDPELTLALPPHLTAATGIDAFTHALEAFVGRRANPYTDLLALESLRLIWSTLPQVVAHGDDVAARASMLLASLWAGTAMDHAGLGLIHALSGPLTSSLHLHHGLANAIITPWVLRFNLPQIRSEQVETLKKIFGLKATAADEALATAVADFIASLGLPIRLGGLGVSRAGIDWDAIAADAARMVMINNNPRPVSVADCRQLLTELR
jgi:alcohol dehydrogenase class IV